MPPGTRLGSYRGVPVIATASHDTASAVAAVPTQTEDFAYLSSGTWSLIGLEMREPVINDAAFDAGVTNEGGVEGTYCLMQNLMGLWLAQQSRRVWAAAGTDLSYEDLTALAESAAPFRSLFDANDPRFLPPGDMPARIRDYCRETGQPEPETVDQVARAIFESLAFKYREVLDKLAKLTGREIDHLHIVGGGSRNPVPEPTDRQRHRSSGLRRTGRRHGARQRAGAVHRTRRDRQHARGAARHERDDLAQSIHPAAPRRIRSAVQRLQALQSPEIA